MVCPVCVVGGVGFILSRVFGLPDVIVAFIIGMLATSTGLLGKSYHGTKMEEKKRSTCSTQYPVRDYVFVLSKMDRIVVRKRNTL